MKNSDTVSEYITRIKNVVRKLKDIEEKISESGVVAKIIDGLPGRFGNFITSWFNIDAAKQTLEYLEDRLLLEEKRLSTREEEISAFIASSNHIRHNPQKGANKSRCDKNYRRNNNNNAEDNARSSTQPKPTNNTMWCGYCRKSSHDFKNCRKLQRKQKNFGNGNNKFDGESQKPVAFVSTTFATTEVMHRATLPHFESGYTITKRWHNARMLSLEMTGQFKPLERATSESAS